MARRTPIKDITDPRWVRAISHPIRIRLLSALEVQSASPKMLSDQLDLSLGVVSYHVRLLESLGLLKLVRTQQRRGAVEHFYEAIEHPRFSDSAWAELDVVSKQRVLHAVLSEAHVHAVSAAAAGGFDAADAHFTRTPLSLDRRGWTELAAASKRWLAEADEIQSQAQERIDAGSEQDEEIGVEMVILLFEAATSVPQHDAGVHTGHRTKTSAKAR